MNLRPDPRFPIPSGGYVMNLRPDPRFPIPPGGYVVLQPIGFGGPVPAQRIAFVPVLDHGAYHSAAIHDAGGRLVRSLVVTGDIERGWMWVDAGSPAACVPRPTYPVPEPAFSYEPPRFTPEEVFAEYWLHRGQQITGPSALAEVRRRLHRGQRASDPAGRVWLGPLRLGDQVWTYDTVHGLAGSAGLMVVRPREQRIVALFVDLVS